MQSKFSLYSNQYSVGQIADTSTCQIDSFFAESVIQFADPVQRGSTENSIKPLAAITAVKCLGFALRKEQAVTGQHEAKTIVDVMKIGRIIVIVKTAVVQDATAYVHVSGAGVISIDSTATDGLSVGKFLASSVSQTVRLIVDGAYVPTDLLLAPLQVNLL